MLCKCSPYVTNIERSIAKIYMTNFAPGPGQATASHSIACGVTFVCESAQGRLA